VDNELAALKRRVTEELDDELVENAEHLVFGKGTQDARVLFLGEAPGAEEDKTGKPFMGRAGDELDDLLASIDLTLDDVYIANILKYRPPDNRDPRKDEIKRHAPYLVDQIKAIEPELIVTLGNFATKFILAECTPDKMGEVPGISKIHGVSRTVTIDGERYTVIPLYHPAAMLYNPGLRDTLEGDFQTIKHELKQTRLNV
jgi:DNA polymerase